MTVGEYIKQLRLENGMTQEYLARMASMSNGSISSYEKGKTFPSWNACLHLGLVLGVEPIELWKMRIETQSQ